LAGGLYRDFVTSGEGILKASTAWLATVVLVLLGCGGPNLTWQQKMNSSAGVERAQAVMTVGEKNMWPAIPQVINRLEDNDVSVRVLADETLCNMTGKDFGYNAYADEKERREAVARWRSWWESEGKAATVKPGSAAGGKS
jgi:hypothetical protein